MRILFTTGHVNDVSTVLNRPNLARLNEIEGVHIDFFGRDYGNYDVVLFMCYDPDIAGVRKVNPLAKVGIVDARPSMLDRFLGADFLLVNGIEARDRFADYFANMFIYYIYPDLQVTPRQHEQKSSLVMGYHGNKVHLQTMFPYATAALEALAEDYQIELWAIYNVKDLGPCEFPIVDPAKVRVREIQWSEDALQRYVPQMDIGLVPNLIPIADDAHAGWGLPVCPRAFNEHESDFLFRFKCTTNAGRIFVFAQCGVPVVADMVPSALDIIRDGENGFVAASAGGWYRALKQLADSTGLRERFGVRLRDDCRQRAGVDGMNRHLVDFLRKLPCQKAVPESIGRAHLRLQEKMFLAWARDKGTGRNLRDQTKTRFLWWKR
jgi:glycosyltransferase involved in cell wall biosynthesis